MARFPSKLSQILVYPFKCLNTVARMEVKYISITFVIQVDLEERYKLHLGISSLTIKGKSLPQCSEHTSHNSGDSLEAQHQGSVGGEKPSGKITKSIFRRKMKLYKKFTPSSNVI